MDQEHQQWNSLVWKAVNQKEEKQWKLEVEERRCLISMSGEIEDESHFVIDCALYDDLREKFKNVLMKEGIEFGEERKTEGGKLLQLLLGTGLQGANKEAAAKLRHETLNFCRGAMRRRRAVVLRLDQRI